MPEMEGDELRTGVEDPLIAIHLGEDEHSSKEMVLQKYFVQEWKLVKSFLDDIVSHGCVSDPSAVHKIRSIMDRYQEQGQLLEPYLESIVSPLMFIVCSKTIQHGANSLEVIKPLCIIIYSLVTVCGYKAVSKFFPHQVSDLELAIFLLGMLHDTKSISSLRQESTGEMEAKCVILLWLSILVLVPFDIISIDSSISNTYSLIEPEPSPLVLRIINFSEDYLSSAGPMRSIAGLLLSRLLTRPDMSNAFTRFIEWTHNVLSLVTVDNMGHFRLLGVVEALAAIFKSGVKEVLLYAVPIIWMDISILMKSITASKSTLLRKFLLKLIQRIGITCLPHHPASWRYMVKIRPLAENMGSDTCNEIGHDVHAELSETIENSDCLNEDTEVPEIVEEIMGFLLSGLRDKDTVVRWSAAKGIGRMTFHLTSDLSADVLSSVLELFSSLEGDGSWHGGCLALAELARRGLILPASLPNIVPFVVKALHYDIRRGPHSVGSHVRDASAYVCWAFGRAYSYTEMKSIFKQFAPHLLTMACYDREVNCRRAGAAAFQENVGRQGNYPHGIDIVNTADYFALSSRVHSYLYVAACIAQYKEYIHPFISELMYTKICHWDKSLRELAAKSLAILVKYDSEYFANFVLGEIISSTLSSDLCARHGATLATGEIVLALHHCSSVISMDMQKSVAGVVPAIEKARLYRGKGGEVMRAAVSRFVECISLSHLPLPLKVKQGMLNALNENLKHPSSHIQGASVNALKYFVPAYLTTGDDEGPNGITSKYMEMLSDPNVAARRGSALALGVLPYNFLARRWRAVLSKLCESCAIEENPEDRDVETRVNAVTALTSVCEILANEKESDVLSTEDAESFFLLIKNDVMMTLFNALEDYSVDKRGDVGSWVREVAMISLERCTILLCQSTARHSSHGAAIKYIFFDANLATVLVGGIIKQAIEKMDKLRETAVKVLQRILYNEKIHIPCIPYREKLEQVVPNSEDLKWGVASFSYPRLVQLLQFSCYSRHLVSGLVISIGELLDCLRKAAVSALVAYLQDTGSEDHSQRTYRESALCGDILWVLKHYQKCDRVIISTLKTIEILFSKKMLNMEVHGSFFCAGVLESLDIELKGSKDFNKLNSGISILGYIASLSDPINTNNAFSRLLFFLGHRYPKIRKTSAEQIYLVLLQNPDLMARDNDADNIDKAMEIISEICWEGDIEVAKKHRYHLLEMAGFQTKLLPKNGIGKKNEHKSSPADENESYSSLVDSSGF